jgi:hypothetical protein
MKHLPCFSIFLGCLILIQSCGQALAWGFWAHKRINRIAVYTLPDEMFGFYKKHIEYLSEHAVDPDRRRYAVKAEAPRHYIDADHYGLHPFDSLPQLWSKALIKYTEDSLNAHGINPWYIEKMLFRLTKAFEEGDTQTILHLSADIGHYIADAHVPLHTTKNYNGQFTGQVGIHALWESRLPELWGENYDYIVERSIYIDKPRDLIWRIVAASYAATDTVLKTEKEISKKFPPDKKYSLELVGNSLKSVYSPEYASKYSQALDHMVERRMRLSIFDVGSFWYTAWVNAGQPDLEKMEARPKANKRIAEERKDTNSAEPVIRPKGHTD